MSEPRRLRLWLATAAVLCAISLGRMLALRPDAWFTLPITPVDRVDGTRARQWLFLESSRPHVPAGASFTVVAEDPDVEMALYMMSFGLFPKCLPVPTRYYGIPTAEDGRTARYVLAFGEKAADARGDADDPMRLVARVAGGAVFDRGRP